MATITGGRLAAIAATALLAGGCSGKQIDEDWLGRLPEQQMQGVDRARAEVRQRQDQLLRADLAMKDAARALDAARHDAAAVEEARKADLIEADAARAMGQQPAIARAEAQLRRTQATRAVALARMFWFEKRVEALDASRQLEQRQVEVAEASLRLAQYEALRDAGDVRVEPLVEADFHTAIAAGRRRVAEADRKARQLLRDAAQAEARFNRLRERAPSNDLFPSS